VKISVSFIEQYFRTHLQEKTPWKTLVGCIFALVDLALEPWWEGRLSVAQVQKVRHIGCGRWPLHAHDSRLRRGCSATVRLDVDGGASHGLDPKAARGLNSAKVGLSPGPNVGTEGLLNSLINSGRT